MLPLDMDSVITPIANFLDAHPWVLITIIAHGAILGTVAYLILLERKVASWVQDRIGPNRVGLGFGIIPFLKDKKMFGLGQPLADGVKFILKEDYQPAGVDKYLFTAAPMIMIVVIIISIAVLPWGGVKQSTHTFDITGQADQATAIQEHLPSDAWILKDATGKQEVNVEKVENADNQLRTQATVTYRYNFQSASLNIGVLYVLAVLSLSVYGVVIGGWASNNKYSFLGGLRATANMISYEIPLGLAVLCIVLLFGTLNLEELVNKQAHYWWGWLPAWNIFSQPLTFVMFLICIHAEANRAPFDMAEAEQELVGGYHTEYSAMRFALFFLAEYAGMITTSVVCVALFFGGWHLPWIEWAWPALRGNVDANHPEITTSLLACIVRAGVFFGKSLVVIFIFMWTRWSLPRFRFDQLMQLAWRGLIPISLALLIVTAIVVYFFGGAPGYDQWLGGWTPVVLFLANVLLFGACMIAAALLPPAPDTNRKIRVPNSRFARTPVPGGMVVSNN